MPVHFTLATRLAIRAAHTERTWAWYAAPARIPRLSHQVRPTCPVHALHADDSAQPSWEPGANLHPRATTVAPQCACAWSAARPRPAAWRLSTTAFGARCAGGLPQCACCIVWCCVVLCCAVLTCCPCPAHLPTRMAVSWAPLAPTPPQTGAPHSMLSGSPQPCLQVCNNRFGLAEASAACRQLGLPGPGTVLASAYVKPGSGPIFFSGLYCATGQETRLQDCYHSSLGNKNWWVHRRGRSLLLLTDVLLALAMQQCKRPPQPTALKTASAASTPRTLESCADSHVS